MAVNDKAARKYQSIPPSSVIVFHPGSRNLYFGKATDAQPQSILHGIGRRRTSSEKPKIHRDAIIPITEKHVAGKVPPEVESARLQLSCILQSVTNSGDTPRKLSSIVHLASCNKTAKKRRLSSNPVPSPNNEKLLEKQFIVGNDVFKLSVDDPFNIHFPWRRGQLNLHRNIGGSITSVMTDLEDIWRWCVVEMLLIPPKEICNYRAVVVVPAMFDRVHAKEIMNLVINRLGFENAFLIQDHVCATFGSALACATVVDVGDQKISVSCVEDGVSYPQSRVELKYGGGDLTFALWIQLNLTAFPLPITMSEMWDFEFINSLKEKYCHLNTDLCGSIEEKVIWNKPGHVSTEYNVSFGDELLIVPLSYFNPDLLRGSIGPKAVVCYIPQPSVSDDPFDKGYIAESTKRGLKDSDDIDDIEPNDNKTENASKNKTIAFEQLLGMDQAIIQSIASCRVSEDLKRRLFSCVVVVGGGFQINGLSKWLTNRMTTLTPKLFQSDVEDTIPSVKQGTCITVWKGASILATLETAKELWITGHEWRTYGSKILREKSLFHF